jgi:hypothetical protein
MGTPGIDMVGDARLRVRVRCDSDVGGDVVDLGY